VTQTWAKAAGRLANHKRDYVIEVMGARALAMKSAKRTTKSVAVKAKGKKKSDAATPARPRRKP
jgi:hypothetical protein